MNSHKNNIAKIIPSASILVGLLFSNPVVGMAINRVGSLGYSAYLVGGYTGYYTSNKFINYYYNNSEKYYSLLNNFVINSDYYFMKSKYNFFEKLKNNPDKKKSKKCIYLILNNILNSRHHPLGIFYKKLIYFFNSFNFKDNDASIIKDSKMIFLIMDFLFQKIYFQIHSEYFKQWAEYDPISEIIKKKSCNIIAISDKLIDQKYSIIIHQYLQELIMDDLYQPICNFYKYAFKDEQKEIESKINFYQYLPIEDLPFNLNNKQDILKSNIAKETNTLFVILNKVKTGYRKLRIISKIQKIISNEYLTIYQKTGGAEELFPLFFYFLTVSDLKFHFFELMFLVDYYKYHNLTGINGYCLTNFVAVISLIKNKEINLD